MPEQTYDAIVVGAGHNGLVTGVFLARAGWSVAVVEGAETAGGAVRSDEVTLPGFVHDLCSTNQNGFVSGPVWGELEADLRRHGLAYAHSPNPYANAYPDGTSLKVFQDAERTLAGLRAHDPADAEGWSELHGLFGRYAPLIFGVYGGELPSLSASEAVAGALTEIGPTGVAELAQLILSSTRELGEAYLSSPEAKALMASWGMHVDSGPDVSGGAMFPFVECFADMHAGMSIAQGGASRLIDALAGVLREHGGELRTGTPVERIRVEGGRACCVELAGGETLRARRAVVASVTPDALFGRLLDERHVPAETRRTARRWQYGPGTLMLHLALDGPVPWTDRELGEFAYVHLGPYVEQLSQTYTDAVNGILPEDPLLVVGQSSVVDPTRAPEGKHVLWVQVRVVPSEIRGDRCGEIDARTWADAGDAYADRVLAKLERYAPGIGRLVLARAVMTPDDLQAIDPNLVGGDNGGGSHHLHQNFLLRPLPGMSRYRTPVEGLWMTGSATWPGAGVHGWPGYLTAQALLEPDGGRARAGRALAAARSAARLGWRLRPRRGGRPEGGR